MQKKSDIFWIDCDTHLKKDSDFFHQIQSDLSFASHTGTLEGIKASPIGFRYNDRVIEFLTLWSKKCEEHILNDDIDLDHDVLKYEILPQFKNKISVSIMGNIGESKRYTDGDIILNGISRTPDKDYQMRVVLDKNTTRTKIFNRLSIKDYEF